MANGSNSMQSALAKKHVVTKDALEKAIAACQANIDKLKLEVRAASRSYAVLKAVKAPPEVLSEAAGVERAAKSRLRTPVQEIILLREALKEL